ncbi:MAG: glycosyltransferase family 4 protein [Anaerolineae bacterium]|nr:glycosyltransferase family 4 protein [Anaerolineae bacterium]
MKILLFANTDWYLYNFRLPLAHALREQGHQVLLVSPRGKFHHHLTDAGFTWIPIDLSPKGLNPLQEIKTARALLALYRQEKPHLVHHFTIKCVLYGSMAARLSRVPAVVNAITGMGYVFINQKPGARLLRWFVIQLYRLLLRRTRVIFQNPDDRQFFLDLKMVQPENTHVIMGSGVDCTLFTPLPEPDGTPVVTLPARMLWDKGVGEFVAAARILKNDGIAARFVLVGASDSDNPAAIAAAQLKAWEQEGLIEYWGFNDDIQGVLARTNLVCLPSYREGLPRILIEAAACGRAQVTTNVPGCREVVQDGINGLLVPARDAHALAEALRALIEDPARRKEMAKRAREVAVNGFSTERVNRETIQIYQQFQPPQGEGMPRG